MNIKKRILSILISCTLLAGLFNSITTLAAETDRYSLMKNKAILSLLENLNETGDFSAVLSLKDYDNSERYFYLPFLTGGYLIYDKKLDIIHEYSTTESNKYINDQNDLYYLGALSYYQKQNDMYIEIPTGNPIDNTTFSEIAMDLNSNLSMRSISPSTHYNLQNKSNTIRGIAIYISILIH
ncbi:hypothetical protein [Lachnoclostridium phytofermentans]|uniref:Uncharacterized protein n=1 Tax=Lachnoclostridium phytofermentans (strain ATCC 700394 / DSM 18823 / ISDg) TaxID=357809 RepID=A9KQD8_LACP7|nr:hypothetical protein [Lachnoclostridium phytofermentans]ABX40447.1 hypothetical protein Cphy_0057 [Lachnoclostridium phytofermentans ISDg]